MCSIDDWGTWAETWDRHCRISCVMNSLTKIEIHILSSPPPLLFHKATVLESFMKLHVVFSNTFLCKGPWLTDSSNVLGHFHSPQQIYLSHNVSSLSLSPMSVKCKIHAAWQAAQLIAKKKVSCGFKLKFLNIIQKLQMPWWAWVSKPIQ